MRNAFSIPMNNDARTGNTNPDALSYHEEEQDVFDSLPSLEQKFNDLNQIEEPEDDVVQFNNPPINEVEAVSVDEPTPTSLNVANVSSSLAPLRNYGPPQNAISEFQRHVQNLTTNMNVCEICGLPMQDKQNLEKAMYIDQIPMEQIEKDFHISKQAMMHHTVNCIISNNSFLVPMNSFNRLKLKELLDYSQVLQNFKTNLQIETSPDQMVAYVNTLSELRKMIKDIQSEKSPKDIAREINKLVIGPMLVRMIKMLIAEAAALKGEFINSFGEEHNITISTYIDKFVSKLGVIINDQSAYAQDKLAERFDVTVHDIS